MNSPTIYFDYAATTPLDAEILEAYPQLLLKYFANSSSSHALGAFTESLQERARRQIADQFHVDPQEIIFTSGASEANNLAIKGTAFAYRKRGHQLITSEIEHPSVRNTFLQLEKEFGFQVTYLPVDEQGIVNLEALREALSNDTILVSIMAVNNEVGSIQPLKAIADITKMLAPNAFLHTDATQAIGKVNCDFESYDLVSMSAHKIYGLKGSGMLLKRSRVQPLSLISGGSQEFSYRAGTSNWPANVMLAKALRLAEERFEQDVSIARKVWTILYEGLASRDDILVNSNPSGSPFILNFSLKKYKASVVVQALEEAKIYVSTVSACGSHAGALSHVIQAMFHDVARSEESIRLSWGRGIDESATRTFLNIFFNILTQIRSQR